MQSKQDRMKRRRLIGIFVPAAIAGLLLLSACGDKKSAAAPDTPSPAPTVSGGVPDTSPDPVVPDTTPDPVPDAPEYRLTVDAAGYEELSPGSEYLLDGLLYVTLEDFPNQTDTQYDEDTLLARIMELEGDDIRVVSLELSEEYSAQLTYPAWHIVYETGYEEDTALCADIYFQTDTREYRVHTNCNADHAYGYRDELQDYAERIDALFASIALTSESDEAFLAVDPAIDMAVAAINETRRDDLSPASFGFEKKLAYDLLNPEQKALYDEVLFNVRAFEPFSFPADEYGYDVLDRAMLVCGAVALDWPELENYFTLWEVIEGDSTVALESRYFLPWDAGQQAAGTEPLQEAAALFDAACERIVSRIPEGLSAYDKYRYLAAVISFATDFDEECAGGWQCGTAYGAVLGGHSICQGYSRGFMALCEKADLWCV